MATDAARPRPWLLVLLGVALAALLASRIFSSDPPPNTVPTTSAPPVRAPKNGAPIEPKDLDVKLEALKQPAPLAGESARNPFRFKPAPPPPPPPPPPVVKQAPPVVVAPPEPTGPPPPPPITIKFIGVVETKRGKVAAFTDCRVTFAGREGEVIEGRYRVVRLGIESAIVEYVDGRGRTTLPLNGQAQACMGK